MLTIWRVRERCQQNRISVVLLKRGRNAIFPYSGDVTIALVAEIIRVDLCQTSLWRLGVILNRPSSQLDRPTLFDTFENFVGSFIVLAGLCLDANTDFDFRFHSGKRCY